MPPCPLGCRPAPLCIFLALCLIGQSPAADETQGQQTGPPRVAVASAHPAATRAAIGILAAGGNAFDAAVAVGAALAVVEPYSSGRGGGGFWLLHRASDARTRMIDARERAPLAAHRSMYLNDQGQFVPERALDTLDAAALTGAERTHALVEVMRRAYRDRARYLGDPDQSPRVRR